MSRAFAAALLVAMIIAPMSARAREWTYTLRAKSDVVSQALTFGTQLGASDTFDFGTDGLLPPMAPGVPSRMYLWNLSGTNPLFTQMDRDLRAPEHDTLTWIVRTYGSPDSEPTVFLDTLQTHAMRGGQLEYAVAPYDAVPPSWAPFDTMLTIDVPEPNAFHIRYRATVGVAPEASRPLRALVTHMAFAPNPASGHVTIVNVDARALTYEWVTLDGRVVARMARRAALSTSGLAMGVYVVRALDGEGHMLGLGSVTLLR